MEKILTVVVPTYNMEKYLDRCLSSLIVDEERMALLEVLVVNDGSKDRSSEIAHGYEARYPDTFRVIDKENGNYGSCINIGVVEASGKYFRILDADDYYLKDFQNFIQKLKNTDADMVITPFVYSGKTDEHLISAPIKVTRNSIYDINNIDLDFIPLFMHSTTFRHKLLLDVNLQLDTGVSYTDSEYCYFPLQLAETVVFMDDIVYKYNADRDGQTISASSLAKSTFSMYVVSSRLISHYLTHVENVKPIVRKLWEKWLIESCRMYYQTSLTLCFEDDNDRLNEVDVMVHRIPIVDDYVSQLCIHHIHYVRMWRDKGRRYTHPLCRIHNAVWQVIDPIWIQLLKWFCPSRL